jgi:hypothetical protein
MLNEKYMQQESRVPELFFKWVLMNGRYCNVLGISRD